MCRIFAESRRSESNSADLSRVRESIERNNFSASAIVRTLPRKRDNCRFHRLFLHLLSPRRASGRRCPAHRARGLPRLRRAATRSRHVLAAPARGRATSGRPGGGGGGTAWSSVLW